MVNWLPKGKEEEMKFWWKKLWIVPAVFVLLTAQACSGGDDDLCNDGSCNARCLDEGHDGGGYCNGDTCRCVDGSCIPNCSGRECGSDGCGSNCGSCSPGEHCSDGRCEGSCSNVCSESPGCSDGVQRCSDGICESLSNCCDVVSRRCDCPNSSDFPECDSCNCSGRECGSDGCGGSCGSCGSGEHCSDGRCEGGGDECSDGFEPNNSCADSANIGEGTHRNLFVPQGNGQEDYYEINVPAGAQVSFDVEADGAVGVLLYDACGGGRRQLGSGRSITWDNPGGSTSVYLRIEGRSTCVGYTLTVLID